MKKRKCKYKGCWKTLVRRDDESNQHWRKRKYCNPNCGYLGRRAIHPAEGRSCEHCGLTLHKGDEERNDAFAKRRFCNPKCANRSKRLELPLVKRFCQSCQKILIHKRTEPNYRWVQRLFCNHTCQLAWLHKCALTEMPGLKRCRYCDEDILMSSEVARTVYSTRQFCSKRCMYQSRHKQIVMTCVICSEAFTGRPCDSRPYCGPSCAGLARRKLIKVCGIEFTRSELAALNATSESTITLRLRKGKDPLGPRVK